MPFVEGWGRKLQERLSGLVFPGNNAIAERPTQFHIETANSCNLHCRMCSRDKWSISNETMSLQLFERILARIEHAELITLFGLGEPLTNPDIFAMVERCRRRGFPTAFTTNGILLDDASMDQVFESGLDYLRFSIDQVAPSRNNFAHPPSLLVLQNVRKLVARRGSAAKPVITLNTTVHPDGLAQAEEVIRFAAEAKVDGVNLIAVVPQFASEPTGGFSLAGGIETFRHLVEFGRETGTPVWGSGFYDRSWKGIVRYRWNFCPRTTDYLYINDKGDATPCCWMPRYRVGNVFQETIDQIWNGRAMASFRADWKTICGPCNLMK